MSQKQVQEMMKRVHELFDSGVSPADIVAQFGPDQLWGALQQQMQDLMNGISVNLCRLLSMPPPLPQTLIKQLEGRLEDEDIPRHGTWVISMVTGALRDQSAIDSAHAAVRSPKEKT